MRGTIERNQTPESSREENYLERIKKETEGPRIWDYLRYDEKGDLWVNELRIKDAIRLYGTPLEIVDTTIVERRCQEWKNLAEKVAEEVGYTGGLEYFFAAKANMSAEIAHAAYRSGWHAETSSTLDLENIKWLRERGLIDRSLKIICNGFKLPPQCYGLPEERPKKIKSKEVNFVQDRRHLAATHEIAYADNISLLRSIGFDIVPILDSGEFNYFAQREEIPAMEVGLRLKFGKVTNDEELTRLVSRHGMAWEELKETAEKIERVPHLTLTMFHAMVGAAETIPVDTFVDSLLFAADKYFELKKDHPTLKYFNMGGGMAPMSEDYNHREFLEKFLSGLKQKAEAANLPQPTVIFEFGSYVAAESGFHVFKIIQEKESHLTTEGKRETWAIVDGGLMAAIPDMLVIDKEFRILAANNAHAPGKWVRIGDVSCDSDGRYPPKPMEPKKVLVPNAEEETYLVILTVGAYQEILAGIRGAHHCGLLEAAELILERRKDGKVYGRLMSRQTRQNARELLGYSQKAIRPLKRTLKNA